MAEYTGKPPSINGTYAHSLKFAPSGYVEKLPNRAGRRARAKAEKKKGKRDNKVP